MELCISCACHDKHLRTFSNKLLWLCFLKLILQQLPRLVIPSSVLHMLCTSGGIMQANAFPKTASEINCIFKSGCLKILFPITRTSSFMYS